jgi:membrane-anchored mycosin MYCP
MRRRTAPTRPAVRAGCATAALALTAATALTAFTAVPATAADCPSPPKPTQVLNDSPWPLAMWDLDRLPPSPGGEPIVVAVLDSGVSAVHPQLRGQVLPGKDKLASGNGQQDCVGHGTGVASLIAAKPAEGTKFRGLAPNSRIYPIRVSENIVGQQSPGGRQANQASPAKIAEAVDEAVAAKARVINLSFTYDNDDDSTKSLKEAIGRAVSSNVVVVAAAGNNHLQSPAPGRTDPISYPAAWDGVLGVGAIGQTGQRQQMSQVGPYVDLVAPGEGVMIAAPAGGHVLETGTSYAAPLVAATAALILEYFPDYTAQQVIDRILATTDPAAGGSHSEGYGVGVVNPVRAVTELIDGSAPLPAAKGQWPTDDPQQQAAKKRAAELEQRATWIGGIGLLGAALAVVLTVSLPAARRRRWRPAGR